MVSRVIHLLIITPAPAPAGQKGERVSLVLWMSHNRVHFSRVQGGLVRVVIVFSAVYCMWCCTMEAETRSWSCSWSWFLFMSPTLQSAMKVGRRGGGQQPGHFLPPSVLWSQEAIIYTNGRNVFSTRKEEIVPPSPALSAAVFAEQLPGYAVHRVQGPGDSGGQMTKAGCGFYLHYCDIRWMQG